MVFQGGFGDIEGIHDLLSGLSFGDHGAKFYGVKFRCDRHGKKTPFGFDFKIDFEIVACKWQKSTQFTSKVTMDQI